MKKHEIEFYKKVGANMKRIRMANKDNQEHVADLFGVTWQQIQKYENGINRLPLISARKFCRNYKASMETLMEGK